MYVSDEKIFLWELTTVEILCLLWQYSYKNGNDSLVDGRKKMEQKQLMEF